MISVVCSLLENLVSSSNYDSLEYWFVFCFSCGVGMCLSEIDGVDYRKQFSTWWKAEMKTIKYPTKGTIFDYFANDAKLEEWSSIVEPLEYRSDVPMNEVTVPTSETVSITYIMKALVSQNHPVMLIGLAGCGKTQSCLGLLKGLNSECFAYHAMNMS